MNCTNCNKELSFTPVTELYGVRPDIGTALLAKDVEISICCGMAVMRDKVVEESATTIITPSQEIILP